MTQSGTDVAPGVDTQVEQMLSAGERRGMTQGVEHIRRALTFWNTLAPAVERAAALSPQMPAQRTETTPRPPDPNPMPSTPQKPSQGSERPRSGPGHPPAPSEQARCKHSDPSKGPCQREPHDPTNTRHRYRGDGRSARATAPAFSDKPLPTTPRRDASGRALRKGSPVTYVGNGALPTGWSGKIEEFTDDGKALVYGFSLRGKPEHKKPSEQVLSLDQLKWSG